MKWCIVEKLTDLQVFESGGYNVTASEVFTSEFSLIDNGKIEVNLTKRGFLGPTLP